MQDKFEMFENRLAKVYKHLAKIAKNQQITCFRIYDKDLPEFPLIIEKYDDKIYIAEYKSQHRLTEEEYENWFQQSVLVIEKVLQVDNNSIFIKERKRKTNRQDQYQKIDDQKEFFTVFENKLQFKINLTDFLDTGLFLDHRITRKMVQDESANKKVLNLFSYTGSFSVYAAAANAAEVVSVDLSNTYTNWAKENMEINNFYIAEKHQFIKADVMQYINEIADNHFDIIILDPPTFSNSKMMNDFFDVQKDHVALINSLIAKLAIGGVIYFSNNFTKFVLDKENIKASAIKDITKQTTPFDFEKKLKRCCYKIWK